MAGVAPVPESKCIGCQDGERREEDGHGAISLNGEAAEHPEAGQLVEEEDAAIGGSEWDAGVLQKVEQGGVEGRGHPAREGEMGMGVEQVAIVEEGQWKGAFGGEDRAEERNDQKIEQGEDGPVRKARLAGTRTRD